MGQRNVRVVVGQGDPEHAGSLRAVLERDGFEVVGDASDASQLARVLTDEQPDIVVLDDMIGVGAVELAAEIVPEARLVVVWPAAVMPIAGAVRVDPTEVATALSATVALAAGLSGLATIDRPEWIERVKKDPAMLREMLAARGALPKRPSVTELQRRGHRLHPSRSAAKRAAHGTDAAAASVIPIGLGASQRDAPPSAPAHAAAAASVPPDVLGPAWNRRLGIIALGGAAAAGALMIALALGPHPSSIVSSEPFPNSHGGGPAIILAGGTQNPGTNGGTTTGGGNTDAPGGPAGGASGAGGNASTGGPTPHGNIRGLGTGTGGSSGGSGSGSGAGSPGGPNSSHLPGAHGTGKPGVPGWQGSAAGRSGDHNPHGGPPGHGTDDGQGSSHGHGTGNVGGSGNSGEGDVHGNGGGHNGGTHGSSDSHGNGHAYGHTAGGHGHSPAAHRHKR